MIPSLAFAGCSLGDGLRCAWIDGQVQGYETTRRTRVPCFPKLSRCSTDHWSRPGGCCSNNGRQIGFGLDVCGSHDDTLHHAPTTS